MKTIYIATARGQVDGETIQENAYTNAELALTRAKLMCDDINNNSNLGINVYADVMPMDLYEEGDVIPYGISSTD